MMSKSILNANVRSLIGSAESKALRRNNIVPAILYGNNIENQVLELEATEVNKYLHANGIGSSVYLQINGEEVFAIIKDFQRDVMSRTPIHIDFQALTMGENIKVNVPVHYLGRTNLKDGLILQTFMDSIEIQTMPKYLIDKVEIDLTDAELGDTIHVSDLPLMQDENIEILTDATLAVYAITEPTRFVEPDEDEDEVAAEEPVIIPE